MLSSGRIIVAPCDTPASKESDPVPHLQRQPFPHSFRLNVMQVLMNQDNEISQRW